MERCKVCYPGDPMVQCELRGEHEGHQRTTLKETPTRLKNEVVRWTGGWEIPLALPKPAAAVRRWAESMSPRLTEVV